MNTINKLTTIIVLKCIDLKNFELAANYFFSNKSYLSIGIRLNYEEIWKFFKNSINLDSFFPLLINVYHPNAPLGLLNYDQQYSKGSGLNFLILIKNITKTLKCQHKLLKLILIYHLYQTQLSTCIYFKI